MSVSSIFIIYNYLFFQCKSQFVVGIRLRPAVSKSNELNKENIYVSHICV